MVRFFFVETLAFCFYLLYCLNRFGDLGAPNLVVGVCPKIVVKAPDSALKDSDSGR